MSIAQSARELARGIRRFQKPGIVLALMIAGFGIAHVHWIVEDTRPMHHWDPYVYLGNLLAFLDGISHGEADLGTLFAELLHFGRPPLYQLMTAPLVLLLGRSVDAALMINVFFMALLVVSTYDAARLVTNERAGYLAAFLVSTYPTMAHLAHVYRPHYAVPACVALSLALLLRVVRDRSPAAVWWLGLSVVFGWWIHPGYGLFGTTIIGFAALGAVLPRIDLSFTSMRETAQRLLALLKHPLTVRAVLPALLLTTALTAVWYGPIFVAGIKRIFVARSLTDPVAVDSGLGWHLRNAPSSISNVLLLAAIAAFLNFTLRRRLMTTTLLFGVVGAYLGPAVVMHRPDWWHAASLFPPIAVLTACWIVEIRGARLARVVFATVVAVATFNFSVAMWDVDRKGGHLSRMLGAPDRESKACRVKSRMIFCPDPPQDVPWPYMEILEPVMEDRVCQAPPGCRIVAVGAGNFNSYIFGYTAQRYWPRAPVVVESQGLPQMPFPLRCFLESDYVLFVDFPGKIGPESEVSYSVATRVLLQSPPAALAESFETIGTFELPNGRLATVARRTGTGSEAEVEAVAEALRTWRVPYDRDARPPAGGRCTEASLVY